jgi:hypothetical protein
MARPNKSRISKLTNDINNKKSEHKCSDFFVVPPGIEPGTQGFSVLCSTN